VINEVYGRFDMSLHLYFAQDPNALKAAVVVAYFRQMLKNLAGNNVFHQWSLEVGSILGFTLKTKWKDGLLDSRKCNEMEFARPKKY